MRWRPLALECKGIEILPFHTLGLEKYKAMGMPYRASEVRTPTNEEVNREVQFLRENLPKRCEILV